MRRVMEVLTERAAYGGPELRLSAGSRPAQQATDNTPDTESRVNGGTKGRATREGPCRRGIVPMSVIRTYVDSREHNVCHVM